MNVKPCTMRFKRGERSVFRNPFTGRLTNKGFAERRVDIWTSIEETRHPYSWYCALLRIVMMQAHDGTFCVFLENHETGETQTTEHATRKEAEKRVKYYIRASKKGGSV